MSSAKRRAGEQITQFTDIEGTVGDDAGGGGGQAAAQFKKADAQTMAGRRIVKARRKGRGSTPKMEEPKAAPQWGFNSAATQSTGDGSTPAFNFVQADNATPAFSWTAPTTPTTTTPTFNFGATSSTPGGGAAGPAPTFGFGAASDGVSASVPAFNFGDASKTTFGSESTAEGFAAAATGETAQTFNFGGGDEGDGDVSGFSSHAPIVEVEEQEVKTGEEDETKEFEPTRSKLFIREGKAWKERGIGKVSINVTNSDRSQGRVLFRTEQVGIIRLNQRIFAAMSCKRAGDKGVELMCLSDKGLPQSYFIRFAKPAEAVSFLAKLEEAKGRCGGSGNPGSSGGSGSVAAVKRAEPTAAVSERPVKKVAPSKQLGVCVLSDTLGVAIGLVTLTREPNSTSTLIEASVKKVLQGSTLHLSRGLKDKPEVEIASLGEGQDVHTVSYIGEHLDMDVSSLYGRSLLLLEPIGNEVVASGVIGVGDPE